MTLIEVQTPRGHTVTLAHREGTTDLSTIGGHFRLWGKLEDEYGLGDLYPQTFLDIGGHAGYVSVSVLTDNPDCRAVIVEPLPENIGILRENLEANGLADRATVVHGAIGHGAETRIGYTLPRVPDAGDIHRYVGAPVADDYAGEAITSPTYPLGDLMDLLGDTVDLAKIDCEGCEWVALKDGSAARADRWVGEYHPEGNAATVRRALAKSHRVETRPHEQGGTGLFTAVRR